MEFNFVAIESPREVNTTGIEVPITTVAVWAPQNFVLVL